MIYQTDGGPVDFQKYSCNFLCLLHSRLWLGGADWTLREAVDAWNDCKRVGIISGDLNKDGDYDDPGEVEILNYDRLFNHLELPLEYVAPRDIGIPVIVYTGGVERALPTDKPLDSSKYYILERWKWKISHFIAGDGTGKRDPIYDPIKGGSMTRQNGKVQDLRVFKIRGA